MKTADGFQQSYNAQAAVEVASRLIVGQRVTPAPNDQQELPSTVAAVVPAAGPVAAVLADSGCYSEQAVQKIEQLPDGARTGTTVYAPLEKTSHHRSGSDLAEKPEPDAPPADASMAEKMRHRLKTAEGKKLYKLRQQTVEPVFGIIKSAMGFRPFLLRGISQVSTEWTLVCLAYNLRRLHTLKLTAQAAVAG